MSAQPEPTAKAVDGTPDKSQSMLRMMLPHVPLVVRVAILHILRLTPQSKYLDLRTEVIVAVMRAFMNPSKPPSVSAVQKQMSRYPSIKGRMWISTYACPPPPAGDTTIKDYLSKGIDGLWHPKIPKAAYLMPEPVPVEAEWTGYRAEATADSRLPEVSQKELYDEMMKEVKSPVTILYFHGGAHWLMDPASHRPTCKKLAKLTGGRVYSVRYRLAPQNPFPAGLMDALQSYLALLHPPEGAFHEPVKPEHIVFAGDSAGGNLALSLLQLLLHLSQSRPPPIPLPAGVALNSPWLDITHSSPSCTANAAFDYLPTPQQQSLSAARRPACAAWPATNPPRRHLYAADALVAHPLVSPATAPSWRGAPPVWLCTGWELLADEDWTVAGKMWREGVPVVLEEYEAMPHCFALVFPRLREARRCMDGWAGFVKAVVEGEGGGNEGEQKKKTVESRFVRVRARTVVEERVEPEEVVKKYGEEEARERVWRRLSEGWGGPPEGVAKL